MSPLRSIVLFLGAFAGCSVGFQSEPAELAGDDDLPDDDSTSATDDDTGGDDDTTVDDETSGDDDASDDDTAGDDDTSSDDDTSASAGACSALVTATCGWTVSADTSSASATDSIDSWSCSGWDGSGPELGYRFQPTTTGQVTASLSGIEGGDLDIYIIEDTGDGCSPSDCLEYGDTDATFDAQAGRTYYLVVDGFDGATGSFLLEVACGTAAGDDDSVGDDDVAGDDDTAPPPAEDCDNGLDDDGDAWTDCDDPGCASDPGCSAPAGGCSVGATIGAGAFVSGNNGGGGSTDVIDTWTCMPSWDESGPEYVYSFTAPTDGTATATLSIPGWFDFSDLDLFLLDASMGCNATACQDADTESLTWAATAGSTWYIVVDGFAGDATDFDLDLGWEGPPPTSEGDCADGADEDNDGDTDCADTDCATTSDCTCAPDFTLSCGDSDAWMTTSAQATDAVDTYSCVFWDESGPEYTYTFIPTANTQATVTLSGLGGNDLDVFVLSGGGACSGTACIGYGDNNASFAATAGTTYYIVVDGYSGDSGDYDIELICN